MHIRWVILAAAACILLLAALFSWRQHEYGVICFDCVHRARAVERKVLAFTIKREYDTNSETFRGLFPNELSLTAGGPELYERIHLKKCVHRFGEAHKVRIGPYKPWLELSAVDEILRAFARTEDRLSAKKSYAIIQKHRPIDNGDGNFDALASLSQSFGLVTEAKDWQSVIDWYHEGSPLPEDPRKNRPKLTTLLISNHSHVRLNAIDRLAELNDADAWNALAPLMDDPAVARRVADHVLIYTYPQLMGKALRYFGLKDVSVEQIGWPFPGMWPWHQSFSEEQIRALLRQRDIWIDAYCLPHAWLQNYLSLLDEIVTVLNERPSVAAKVAVEQLIAGPWPFGQIAWGDVTTNNAAEPRPPLSAAYREPWTVMLDGRIDTSWLNDEFGAIAREILALGRQPSKQNWARIHVLTERWIQKWGSQWTVAAFAQALKSCDPEQTRVWLQEEIRRLNDPRAYRFTCILAAAGAVADPEITSSLEELGPNGKTRFGYVLAFAKVSRLCAASMSQHPQLGTYSR